MLKMLERMVDRIRSGEPLHPASCFEATVNPFQIEMIDIRLCFNPQTLRFPKQEKPIPLVTDEMVNRFLAWKLPKDFNPDGGIRFVPYPPADTPENAFWPVGTNLLTAEQARAMLEHVLGQTWEARRRAVEAPGGEGPSQDTAEPPKAL